MSGEVLTVAQMAAADNFAAMAGIPTLTLMENAGRAVADAVVARFAPCATAVLCGPGNNGGDGFVAARLLGRTRLCRKAGGIRTITRATPPPWQEMEREQGGAVAQGAGGHGAGGRRAVRRGIVAATGRRGAGCGGGAGGNHIPVVAIDIPSGVAGDTGKVLGDMAVSADLTVTFFRKKPAHLLLPGRTRCGEILVADIGIPVGALDLIRPNLFENTPLLWGKDYPWPQAGGHKYTRGHCVVVSGPMHATGAARLSARAALRIGAGLVSVASPLDAVAVNAAHLTAIMVKPFDGARGLADLFDDTRLGTVVMGPGMGVGFETRALVETALAGPPWRKMVLDADALSSFADDPEALFNRLRPGAAILTPHEGEFERLFPGLLDESASKLEAARAAAVRCGAVVLLKGADTVIARPAPLQESAWAAINANAPATLATAGSGDVLSGLIGGLFAQGLEAGFAAAAAAWLHGDAAGRFGAGLIAEDIPEILPESLSALRGRHAG